MIDESEYYGPFFSLYVRSECKQVLNWNTVMHSHGVCPYCGNGELYLKIRMVKYH